MSRRISKKVREEAALICAVVASRDDLRGVDAHWPRVAKILGTSDEAMRLASKAWSHAYDVLRIGGWEREVDALAESLLRTGWSPS